MKSKVYFIKEIVPSSLLKLYGALNISLKGNVAAKVHSGEKGNQNYLKPIFFKEIVDKLNATIVECNTAYEGARNTSKKHLQLLKEHGWNDYFKVDLLDEFGPDLVLDIPNGNVIKKNYVGKDIVKYDSMIVLSHFKGHPMGGFGGALKQLSIGLASSFGKAYIHGAGIPKKLWDTKQNLFLESMADAASSTHKYFKGNICYINVLKNLSVDCDCCAVAEDPCMKDIGILASLDPIAIDQASIDLVFNSTDPGKNYFIERVQRQNGLHIFEAAMKLNFGNKEYEFIEIK